MLKRPLTRGQSAVLDRLRDERDALAPIERQRNTIMARRTLLVVKAVRAGLSTRVVGDAAGITSAGVSQLVRRWEKRNGD